MKKVKYVLATILLGALGSAFWEICLKKWSLLIINKLMPYLVQSRRDSFYSSVPKSLNFTTFYGLLLFVSLLLLSINISSQMELILSFSRESRKRRLKFMIFLMALTFAIFFAIMYTCFTGIQTSIVARDTTNNIEIVAPYITDTEYKLLRSDFFQIDSKADYDNLINKISAIAEKNHLQLGK